MPLQCTLRSVRLVLSGLSLLMIGVATLRAADKPKPVGIEPLAKPIAYDGEFVEVTNSNTLRSRYASKDFLKDLAFYTDRAKAASKGRKPGTIRIAQVFVREFDIVARHPGNPGGKIEATCRIPEKFITESDEYEKLFAETVFAYSNGAVRIEWAKPIVIDKLLDDGKQDSPGQWWFRPKGAEKELLPHLKQLEDGEVDYLMFYIHFAVRKDNGKEMWPPYGGTAWGNEAIKGAHLLTLNDHEIARSTHELGHHLFDTVPQATEDMTVTKFHGMADAGYFADDLWSPDLTVGTLKLGPVMAYYRDCMRYYYPRDMWERWQLTGKHDKKHEPFTGKAYAWDKVKHDYWFKLPGLTQADLRKLTGLKTLSVGAAEAVVTFNVDASEPLQSNRLRGPVKGDMALNNAMNLYGESAAVLKTATGTWLFVKPQLADLYVDVLRVAGGPAKPLSLYGYVLRDDKGLLVMKYPDDRPLPSDEAGFFRPVPATVRADGLAPGSQSAFRQAVSLSIEPDTSRVATVRYTTDNTEPTTGSPAYTGPIELTDSAVVRAAFFDRAGNRVGGDFRGAYRLEPIEVVADGVAVEHPRAMFEQEMTLTAKSALPGTTLRYTTDGFEPNASSPAYEAPIRLTADTIVNIQAFDADGKPVGATWTNSYSNKGFAMNLTTGKPVTTSATSNESDVAKAVDGLAANKDEHWGAKGSHWLQVDLQGVHTLDGATVVTYWDGGRYYQYTIETSLDGKTWKPAADLSANTEPSTAAGQTVTFAPRPARYVRVNMLKNSANIAVHVVEFRVNEAR